MEKKLIILTGDLASGKTTFATILSNKFGIEAKIKDHLKEKLADEIGFSNREENKKLSKLAVEQIITAFEENVKTGKAMIADANFHDYELETLFTIAKNNGYEVLTLLFIGDLHVLYERFNHRIKFEHRHPAHIHDELNTFENFEKMNVDRRVVPEGSEIVEVDPTTFDYQTDTVLLNKITKFLKK